jgi:small-conductance mechanosensitive channel
MVTRGILYLKFRKAMKVVLNEEQLARESHRTYILALAGFSFSGLLALVVLDAALRQNYQISIYYLFLSFLGFVFALNQQSYKAKRWQDQIATASTEMALLCLILSILAILMTQDFSPTFALSLSIVAISVWLVDHVLRLIFVWKTLSKEKENTR